ncbi:MAG: zinc ribbon domain-containing protein [Solibacillus sp.]
MKTCKNCQSAVEAGTQFCEECGTPVFDSEIDKQQKKLDPRPKKTCLKCHSPVEVGAQFCEECGTPVLNIVDKSQVTKPNESKNKICLKCHKLVEADATFCEECGNSVRDSGIKNKMMKTPLFRWGTAGATVVLIIFVFAQLFNNDEVEQAEKVKVEQPSEEKNMEEINTKETEWRTEPLIVSKHNVELYSNESGSIEFTGYSRDTEGNLSFILKYTGLLVDASFHGTTSIILEDGAQLTLPSLNEVRIADKAEYHIYKMNSNSEAKIIRIDTNWYMDDGFEQTSVKIPEARGTIEIAGTKNFATKKSEFLPIVRENDDMTLILNSVALETTEGFEGTQGKESIILSGEVKPKKEITRYPWFKIVQPQLGYFDSKQMFMGHKRLVEGTTIEFSIEDSYLPNHLSKDGIHTIYFSIDKELFGIDWEKKKELKDVPLTRFLQRNGYGRDEQGVNGFVDVEGERVYDAVQLTDYSQNYYVFDIPVGDYKELSFRLGAGKKENTSNQPYTITIYGEDSYEDPDLETSNEDVNPNATVLFEEKITNKTALKKFNIDIKGQSIVYLKIDRHANPFNNREFEPYPVIIEGMKVSK